MNRRKAYVFVARKLETNLQERLMTLSAKIYMSPQEGNLEYHKTQYIK